MTTATIQNASEPVLVDSSGWLEYITGDSKAELFAPFFEGDRPFLVPTIVLYEVRKILLLRNKKTEADLFVSQAFRKEIVDLSATLSLAAVEESIHRQLPMADAIIYATARKNQAELVTSDMHFSGLPSVTIL